LHPRGARVTCATSLATFLAVGSLRLHDEGSAELQETDNLKEPGTNIEHERPCRKAKMAKGERKRPAPPGPGASAFVRRRPD
jgi:hypothetical protein